MAGHEVGSGNFLLGKFESLPMWKFESDMCLKVLILLFNVLPVVFFRASWQNIWQSAEAILLQEKHQVRYFHMQRYNFHIYVICSFLHPNIYAGPRHRSCSQQFSNGMSCNVKRCKKVSLLCSCNLEVPKVIDVPPIILYLKICPRGNFSINLNLKWCPTGNAILSNWTNCSQVHTVILNKLANVITQFQNLKLIL